MEGGVYVSNILFDENGHLTEILLKALKSGLLKDNDLISVSEHICNCEACANTFAESFNSNELSEAPLGFEEEIIGKIKKKRENDTQLVFYSLRVAIAACIALFFVFSNTLNFVVNTNARSINPPNLSIVNSINSDLNNFSQKIISMEVFNNEKEKK